MSMLRTILLLLWCLAYMALAGDQPVTLAWDKPAAAEGVDSWMVLRGIDVVATVRVPRAVVRISEGETAVFQVIASSGGKLSAPSAPIWIAVPAAPLLTIQGSPDLLTWHNIPRPGDRFFRIQITTR